MVPDDIQTEAAQAPYPEANCMMCGQECEVTEQIPDTITGRWAPGCKMELWCYCRDCDVDTFHPIPD
jgi:hypothetical protein